MAVRAGLDGGPLSSVGEPRRRWERVGRWDSGADRRGRVPRPEPAPMRIDYGRVRE